MCSQSLIHDHAVAIAAAVTDVFNLREEERKEAFDMIYERVKLGLEHYESKADRRDRRLRPITPSENKPCICSLA